jgi:hypothetical protein
MGGMSHATLPVKLPPPAQVREQINAAEEELRALRRLLRACMAAAKAEEARNRRKALESEQEVPYA